MDSFQCPHWERYQPRFFLEAEGCQCSHLNSEMGAVARTRKDHPPTGRAAS
jgi:hypothetical protein